ncbi:STAS domain-containing protein [Actinokineospora auranticolor]|uniref:Anti-sigma factor antagonist n=1 Tax=Actinokineospora auranticolor TaxID=155976 RepID=A0A2S6GIL7_9PSEU|nr:STAS domain-containing protein [Actinokineospora auranticolor]PPK65055.1 anti-anti-sigma factor [Actinokineospora auranticolor]
MNPQLPTVTVDGTATSITVRCAGDIDLATVGDLNTAVDHALTAAPATLVIDLSDVRFPGSCGLATLARTDEHCRANENRLVVVLPPDNAAYRALQITGLLDVLDVVDTVPHRRQHNPV